MSRTGETAPQSASGTVSQMETRSLTVLETVADPAPRARQWASWRRLLLLAAGTAAAGSGIGLMVACGVGVSPIDALFNGTAKLGGMSMGMLMIVASLAMVAVAWAMGTRSGPGTIVTFFGIGLIVDATLRAAGGLGQASMGLRVGVWLAGALLLGVGAAALNSSGLGASAYDQFVRAFTRFGLSLPKARLAVDSTALILGLALAWLAGMELSIGIGTIALLAIIPACLAVLLAPLTRFADRN